MRIHNDLDIINISKGVQSGMCLNTSINYNLTFFQDVLIAGDFNSGCDYWVPDDHINSAIRTNFKWHIDDFTDSTVGSTDCPYDRYVMNIHTFTHAHTYIHSCMYSYKHSSIHTNAYKHTCIINACIHTYIHTYKHTYIHKLHN